MKLSFVEIRDAPKYRLFSVGVGGFQPTHVEWSSRVTGSGKLICGALPKTRVTNRLPLIAVIVRNDGKITHTNSIYNIFHI